MMGLHDLARALGGVVTGQQVLAPGPGHSAQDQSLSVRLSSEDPDGFVVYSHARDPWQACRAHVLAKTGRQSSFDSIPRGPTKSARPPDDSGQVRARELWDEGRDPIGSLVERYMAGRCLHLTDDLAGSVVRFHARCPWRDDATGEITRLPAMLTAFRSIANPRVITAVHRTALTSAGEKIGRKMLGAVAGAAIMVDPDENVATSLVVAEGFETALSGRQLGWRPAWALGSAGAIGSFPVLSGIECLIVLAELDDSGANARAIDTVGKRWTDAGRELLIVSPRHGGDCNDALRRLGA